MRRSVFAAMGAVVLVVAGAAQGQQTDETTRAAARSLAAEGDALWDKGDYAGALDRFHRARELVQAPTVRVREAECLEKVGKWVEAVDAYRQVSRVQLDAKDPEPFRRAVERAKQQGPILEARLPKLHLVLRGADLEGAKIAVDGRDVPKALWGVGWPVNPGRHALVAMLGEGRAQVQVDALEGKTSTINVVFPKATEAQKGAAAPPPALTVEQDTRTDEGSAKPSEPLRTDTSAGASQREWGWVSIGVGGAGFVFGMVTGGLAFNKKGALDNTCQDGKCPTAASSDVDAYNRMITLSTVGFAVGAVGVGTGLVLLLTAPHEPAARTRGQLEPWIGFGTLGLKGRF